MTNDERAMPASDLPKPVVSDRLRYERRGGKRQPGGIPRWWVAGALIVFVFALFITANGLTTDPLPLPPPITQVGTAEEQLAARYTPVVYLRRQTAPCDRTGEPYLPAPVETVLDDPAVTLRQINPAGGPDAVIKSGPVAADLAGKDKTYYLDLPGNPRNPGCDYEQAFRARMGQQEPVIYAHIVRQSGTDQLALQYWFFYYFDDFVNTHEGDWEMIQLVFDAPTVEAALATAPSRVAYAQHNSGEVADWAAAKLRKEDGRPVAYPAAGSHGTYYGSDIYIGWGRDGAGFGCDNTAAPVQRVLPRAILVPNDPDPTGSFAWLRFGGRWGQRGAGPFNGPSGPQTDARWTQPITWMRGLRPTSVVAPAVPGVGASSTEIFCSVTGRISATLTLVTTSPIAATGGVLLILVLFVGVYSLERELVRATLRLYREHWAMFVLLGSPLVFLALVIDLGHLAAGQADAGPSGWGWLASEPMRMIASSGLTYVQDFVVLCVVGPATVWTIVRLHRGAPYGVRLAYRAVWPRLPHLVGALVGLLSAYILLVVTLVGLPVALWLLVRWCLFGQAVMIDGARTSRGALAASARAVRGHWWRVAITALSFIVLTQVPGPLIGFVVLGLADRSVEFVNTLSGLIFAALVPFGIAGQTLLYLRLREGQDRHRPGADLPSALQGRR